MTTPHNHRRMGITYSAYSDVTFDRLVVTITEVDGSCCYTVEGPPKVAHSSQRAFGIRGDRSLAEATTKALKSLKPSRTYELRSALMEEWKASKLNFLAPPPKLRVLIRTSSLTFAQLGKLLSRHLGVPTKGGRLEPSMRALHSHLHRFDMKWQLLKTDTKTSNN